MSTAWYMYRNVYSLQTLAIVQNIIKNLRFLKKTVLMDASPTTFTSCSCLLTVYFSTLAASSKISQQTCTITSCNHKGVPYCDYWFHVCHTSTFCLWVSLFFNIDSQWYINIFICIGNNENMLTEQSGSQEHKQVLYIST